MSNLYHISQELLQLRDIAEQFELDAEQQEMLAITEQQLATKMTGYNYIIRQLEADVELGKRELTRISEWVERKEKAIDRLKKPLLQALLTFGEETGKDGKVRKLEFDTVQFSTRRSVRTEITNKAEVPDEFFTTTIKIKTDNKDVVTAIREFLNENSIDYSLDYSLSKTAIKQAISGGNIVPGAELKEFYNIVIK
jgi:dTDP-4-amino-4,6-dideoxygalactose transaminase